MKTCPDCGRAKPSRDFGRNRSSRDGLSFYCLACNRERARSSYRRKRARQGREVRDLSWIPEGFRWCPSCRQPVPHEDYTRSPTRPSGFGSQCKACKARADSDGYFYRRYKLTRREVSDLRAAQADHCVICGDASPQHLDHDHATGHSRALLCQRCNHGLGLFRDSPDLLRVAANNIEEHRKRQRSKPLRVRRREVVGRLDRPPVGFHRRPPAVRRTGPCARGRAILAAREADT